MTATISTTEMFSKLELTRSQVETEVKLRVKAGSIKAYVEESGDNWVLKTEWSVVGSNMKKTGA